MLPNIGISIIYDINQRPPWPAQAQKKLRQVLKRKFGEPSGEEVEDPDRQYKDDDEGQEGPDKPKRKGRGKGRGRAKGKGRGKGGGQPRNDGADSNNLGQAEAAPSEASGDDEKTNKKNDQNDEQLKVLEEHAKQAAMKAEKNAREGLEEIKDDEEKDETNMRRERSRASRSTACKSAASPKRRGTKHPRKKTPQKTPKKNAPKEADTAKGEELGTVALTPRSKKKKTQQKYQDCEIVHAYYGLYINSLFHTLQSLLRQNV